MKKLKILGLTLVFACLLFTLPSVFASPTSIGAFAHDFRVPPGQTLLVNINCKVINLEDPGTVGFWALDNAIVHLQIWGPSGPPVPFSLGPPVQLPSIYYFVESVTGNWQTYAGALSPGAGIIQKSDASGTFELDVDYSAVYVAGFLNAFSLPTHGNIGTFDFGGTKADILLGTYYNGQIGSSGDFFSAIQGMYTPFMALSITGATFGSTYHYRSQTFSAFLDTSYIEEFIGDIVVK
jgi:hypothetical protein